MSIFLSSLLQRLARSLQLLIGKFSLSASRVSSPSYSTKPGQPAASLSNPISPSTPNPITNVPTEIQTLSTPSATTVIPKTPQTPSPSPKPTPQPPKMTTETSLRATLSQLSTLPPTSPTTLSLLTHAKLNLLHLNALLPTPSTPPTLLALARQTLETGALVSIRAQNPDAFTRYYQQLQPFYALPTTAYPRSEGEGAGQRSKVTGLYLLLLLTKGDYAGFHTLLEGLEMGEEDKFLRYPVMLEQCLMEGAYDQVWGATKGRDLPSEEFGVFSEVLVHTIRSEIASCSEKAYPSLPIASAKNLLFLESEGSVVAFAQARGWLVKDGRIYFPLQQGTDRRTEREILVASGQVIENTIGYARELETIV